MKVYRDPLVLIRCFPWLSYNRNERHLNSSRNIKSLLSYQRTYQWRTKSRWAAILTGFERSALILLCSVASCAGWLRRSSCFSRKHQQKTIYYSWPPCSKICSKKPLPFGRRKCVLEGGLLVFWALFRQCKISKMVKYMVIALTVIKLYCFNRVILFQTIPVTKSETSQQATYRVDVIQWYNRSSICRILQRIPVLLWNDKQKKE